MKTRIRIRGLQTLLVTITKRSLLVTAICTAAALGASIASGTAAGRTGDGASATAETGSILYLKGGRLWAASPDGRTNRRIPHAGRFESASQADNGTIVALRGINLYRLNRRGRLLNKPFTTAFRTNRILPAYNGPFSPEVSPDGTKVAYTYSFIAAHFDPACQCNRISPSMNTSYTWSNRFTDTPERVFGLARFHSNASWIDNRTVLATTQHLYDYAGNVMDSIGIDALGGGPDSYSNWFSGCMSGCDSVLTLQMYRVDEGEMTRQRDKLVFVSGELNGLADGSHLQIHPMAGLPPAIPPAFCQVDGPNGRFSRPTWSPDGKSLAWADARGVWVGQVGDLSGATCQLTKRLVIPGGSQPDWGPARP